MQFRESLRLARDYAPNAHHAARKDRPSHRLAVGRVTPNATRVADVSHMRHERAVLMPCETDWDRDVVPKFEKPMTGKDVVAVWVDGTMLGEYAAGLQPRRQAACILSS
jgi:hypothetical protein